MMKLRTGEGEPNNELSGGTLPEKPRFAQGCRVAAVAYGDGKKVAQT